MSELLDALTAIENLPSAKGEPEALGNSSKEEALLLRLRGRLLMRSKELHDRDDMTSNPYLATTALTLSIIAEAIGLEILEDR